MSPTIRNAIRCALPLALLGAACGDDLPPAPVEGHGPIAAAVTGALGSPIPSATPEQLATFERGVEVSLRRFQLAEGLGPAFNVTFCGACHEKPQPGGSAGLYRNFFLAGVRLEGGPFFLGNNVALFDCGDPTAPPAQRTRNPPPESATGAFSGVIRMFSHGPDQTARPDPGIALNVIAQRNPIPFYGVGLLAELSEEEILRRANPDDEDGDGISGRPNYDKGFVGRFGLKAQTVSIEAFIRGPLFNHMGITSDPLTDEQRARLPVDSSAAARDEQASRWLRDVLERKAQAAAPSGPNCDVNDVLDPEMASQDLFDLVSFAMLTAAPRPERLDDQRRRGLAAFDAVGCGGCHAPRLEGPRGPLPVYSDLLLHDMGPELADGVVMGEATGSEFRTQPLWGLAAVGPYLHDGRADTIDGAIRLHGGEASASARRYASLAEDERADLIEFLLSLGGRSQYSPGLLPPGQPAPRPGELGGPLSGLDQGEQASFRSGRELFDRDFGLSEGLGAPRMNADSCRACHFEPVIGGAGPRGVNVMRHGTVGDDSLFVAPSYGTILHKVTALPGDANFPPPECNVFEQRQTPALFGAGLIDGIAEEVIAAGANPDDTDGDGISGRVSLVEGGRVGRFGWKAQVPSIREFVRDAVGAELGMTLPPEDQLTFGEIEDDDNVADPELGLDQAASLAAYLRNLAPAPRGVPADAAAAELGEDRFESAGCARCHVPALEGARGPVELYSDLLLHEVLPAAATGIEDTTAGMREFRTAPLWGIAATGPFMHSGAADTLDQAIHLHDGEAAAARDAYLEMSEAERAALIQFLETL